MAHQDDKKPNPFVAMAELWTQGAKAYTESVKSFMELTQSAAREQATQAADTSQYPTEALRRSMQQWSDAAVHLSGLQAEFLEKLMTELPRKTSERFDAQTFSQLSRMASAHWQEEVRRLMEASKEIGEGMTEADASRLSPMLESMAAEYLRDMEMIQATSMEMNLEPLAKAWEHVNTGKADEDEKRTVDRFLKALNTKLQYGAEYYADPDETPVGQTPREEVHHVDNITLYRYARPENVEARGDPVLIIYSIINKPYILDLMPGFSFIEFLLERGHDVYIVDWGETEAGDKWTTLDSYIDPGILSCVQHIQSTHREETGAKGDTGISLFGHCIGGNLALLFASLYPDQIARLVTLTTPGTAAKGGVVGVWTDRSLFPVDAIVDTFGHMPAKLIRYTFMALKPYYEVLKWKMFMEKVHDAQVMSLFYPVDRWANENVDLPGAVFRKFVTEVFHEDRFRNGETEINGKVAALKNVTCPIFNLAASKDWIVPPQSAEVIGEAVGSEEKYYRLIKGSHVAIMIDPRTRPIWTAMSDFLRGKAPR